MRCSNCALKAEFICLCKNQLLCSSHIGSHLTSPGTHTPENLNISLNNSDFQALKKRLMSQIQQIEKEKKRIRLQVNELVYQLESASRSILKEFENLKQSYLLLLGLESLSTSLKKEADKVVISILKIKEIKFTLLPNLNEGIIKGLVSYTQDIKKKGIVRRQNQDHKERSEKKKKEEVKSSVKISNVETEDKCEDLKENETMIAEENIGNEVNLTEEKADLVKLVSNDNPKTQNDAKIEEKKELKKLDQQKKEKMNSLKVKEKDEKKKLFSIFFKSSRNKLLIEKKEFMDSLEIEGYQKLFNNEKENKPSICEIKFSNDDNYSFICKN